MRQFMLPDLGEGLEEAEIVAWHVNEGDHVVTGVLPPLPGALAIGRLLIRQAAIIESRPPICGLQRWSLAPGSGRLSQKSHKVAVLLGITLLSALSLPDRREGGIGGSRYRRPLELSSGGSKFP